MKKTLLYSAFVLAAAGLGSCNRHLDIAPISSISKESFYKTEGDVQGAINGMYAAFRGQTELNMYVWGEARSEMLTSSIAGNLGYDRYYNNSMTVTATGPDWGGLYATINAANLLLKYTPDIPFASADAKNDALAQAYAMRAFCYFVLARVWGGVPLRIEPTEGYDPLTIQKPRSTEAEIFAQIKADLDKAITAFPNFNWPSGRAKWSKAGANALKADVYLWTGKRLNGGNADFTTALNAIAEVEKAANLQLLPNFADIFKYANKGNNEIIMAIRWQSSETGNQVFSFNMYSSSATYPAYVPQSQRDSVGVPLAGNGNVWRPTPAVRAQFTSQDLRRAATFIDLQGPGPTDYYTTYGLKYNGTVENNTRWFTSDYILYRYGDIVLMKAEAKNALGQDPTTEMNAIRQRAYGANYASHVFVSGSKAANDDAILKERLLELALEGKRWWDLVRFGKAFDLVPSLAGKQADTWLLYFPVGTATRTRETLVDETPGWK
jgi:hypothetical protein